jgi:uncharacterized protein YegJ (DUF2314 family)
MDSVFTDEQSPGNRARCRKVGKWLVVSYGAHLEAERRHGMSERGQSKVVYSKDRDGMARAGERARETFKYFWRELSWESRRIVPGLSMAAVKVAFCDDRDSPEPVVEHMWVNELDFDGKQLTGILINSPNDLTSVQKGDEIDVEVREIGDWMYSIGTRVYGGFTIDVTRSAMSGSERRAHDAAWGLDFGPPGHVKLVPGPELGEKKKGFFASLFGSGSREAQGASVDPDADHPMSVNTAASYRAQIEENHGFVDRRDDRGWTLLHHMALAGSVPTVEVLLELGANRDALTNHGMTAKQLAETLGWARVVALLEDGRA